jgi:hypothetical protein
MIVEIHKSQKVHSVQLDRTKQIEDAQETGDGLDFSWGEMLSPTAGWPCISRILRVLALF